ncbi:MAG: glycosyltransferase [Azospirillaceae bacterium]
MIPVFNGANYLEQAIDSALSQTWRHIEVIVVDDGSTDGGATRAIMARFGDRIRSLHLERNTGVASAVNAGLAVMRGEYYSWLSHDDFFHPDKTARQLDALRQLGRPGMVFSDVTLVDETGAELPRRPDPPGDFSDAPLWAVLEGWINGCGTMVSRACLEACGPLNPHLPTTHDYDLWFRIARRFPVVRLPGRLATQRVHPRQGSKTTRHLDEASLLWLGFGDRLNRAEMAALAGSPAGFAWRLRRFQEIASYRGGRLAAERLCRQFGKPGLLGAVRRGIVAVWPGRRRDAVSADSALAALRPAPASAQGAAPTETIQEALDRRRGGGDARPAIAFILHDLGGGSARFGAELAEILRPAVDVCFVRAHAGKIEIDIDDRCAAAISLEPGQIDSVARILQDFGVVRIAVLHAIGWGAELVALLDRLALPFDVFLLDYHLISETPHLSGAEERFVGEHALCAGTPHTDPQRRFLLGKAERLIACSADLARRLSRLGVGREVIVGLPPNTRAARGFQCRMPDLSRGEALRVLTLGQLRSAKGRDIVLGVADLARQGNEPIEFHHLGGFTPTLTKAESRLVTWHGLAGAALIDTVCWVNPHIAMFPFQLPETHSYVLSDAMSMGLPIVAADIGAVAERLEGRPLSWLLPWTAQPQEWLDFLKKLPGRLPADRMPAMTVPSDMPELDAATLLGAVRGTGC